MVTIAPTRRATLAGLLAAAATLAFGAPFRALAAAIGARVTAVVNTVTATPNAAAGPQPVAEGDEIPAETEIATARESGAELAFADGAVLVIGQRSALNLTTTPRATLTKGAFRFRGLEVAEAALATPLLAIDARAAEFVVSVADGQTICGVVAGEITCTSIKKGTAAKIGAGQSIAWVAGSFGDGVTSGVFQTGDIAADEGIDAARTAWAPL